MRNDNIEKYLVLIVVLLVVVVALLIPILAKAQDDGWRSIPTTPLLQDPYTIPDPTPVVEEVEIPEPEVTDEVLIRSVITEDEEIMLAQTLYGEDRNCGDAEDTMRQAAVIWSIFNRCDAYDQRVSEVINHSQYHGWFKTQKHPQWSHEIVRDVALRWAREKMGEEDVGRVLPSNYLFFSNGGRHEKFRTTYRNGKYWDWSLENPYEAEQWDL